MTEIFSVPPCARSLAGRVASRTVPLTCVVRRAVPFTRIVEDKLKLLPTTATVSAVLPAETLEGERLLSCGRGLFTGNAITGDVPPPGGGFITVMFNVPGCERSVGSNVVCSKVELT